MLKALKDNPPGFVERLKIEDKNGDNMVSE
jgi:hypothetical protein